MSMQFLTNIGFWKVFITITVFNDIVGSVNVSSTASWAQRAVTVAGQANGVAGSSITYLYWNRGVSISSDDTLYVADRVNNRIVMVKLGSTSIINTFGSGPGSNANQFDYSSDVCVTDTSVYIMDTYNYRVQKYSRNGTNPMTMPGTGSFGTSFNLFIDRYENLYLSAYYDSKVIRFTANSSNPVIVAGNGTEGSSAQQLNGPNGVFVDDVGTVYVADTINHRIQMWTHGASFGVTVAGIGISGNSTTQLSYPESLVVDTNGYMYIVDRGNNRIVRWSPDATAGVCIAACTGLSGTLANQLYYPIDLTFDSNGSMYVSDDGNSRVQKFQILSNTSKSIATTLKPMTFGSAFSTGHQLSTVKSSLSISQKLSTSQRSFTTTQKTFTMASSVPALHNPSSDGTMLIISIMQIIIIILFTYFLC